MNTVANAQPARRLRSVLFAPGSRPDVLAKLPRSNPDGVIIDLEDAVADGAKAAARGHARQASVELRDSNPDLAVFVRVNAVTSPHFLADLAALGPELTGLVVPKIESGGQVGVVRSALAGRGLEALGIVAGIETAAGVAGAAEVFAEGVGFAYFGAEDFVADMGGVRREDNLEVLFARSQVAMFARLAGIVLLDQIVTRIGDDDSFSADAQLGRAIGYRGKMCIHPRQVPLANAAFSPTEAEVDRARRLLVAYQAAAADGLAAIAFEGQMVDEPLAAQARTILAAAARE